MVADRIDVGPDPLRMADLLVGTQRLENAQEGFLAGVFDQLPRSQPRMQFDPQQILEVGDEMPLGLRVSAAKTMHVGGIEALEVPSRVLHGIPSWVLQR